MIMNANVCGGRRIIQHGFDVTDSVQLRITNGTILESEQTDAALIQNALTCLRKEAIWQYCIRRLRGFLFWAVDHSIRLCSTPRVGERISETHAALDGSP
jgi:hypothetical protein